MKWELFGRLYTTNPDLSTKTVTLFPSSREKRGEADKIGGLDLFKWEGLGRGIWESGPEISS